MNLKKLERYLRVNLLGPGPRLLKKRIYRAAVSQSLTDTGLRGKYFLFSSQKFRAEPNLTGSGKIWVT